MNLIETQQLTIGYGNKPLLDKINFALKPQQICCLLGAPRNCLCAASTRATFSFSGARYGVDGAFCISKMVSNPKSGR